MTDHTDTTAALESAAQWLNDAHDLLTGVGAHSDHTQQQVGRCVFCSCGKRVQGWLPNGATKRGYVYQVKLADGFVCYEGPEASAREVQMRHPGSIVDRVVKLEASRG